MGRDLTSLTLAGKERDGNLPIFVCKGGIKWLKMCFPSICMCPWCEAL